MLVEVGTTIVYRKSHTQSVRQL